MWEPRRSQGRQAIEVMRAELHRLSEGVDAHEFHRAVVGMKSSLVMQGESTSARAMALASDQYIHGRRGRWRKLLNEWIRSRWRS
ncbi:MAG: hypothetical protein HC898_13345 [Phycisphaerales bacterium]|nr:hypothetical protein [Phycisphaerales bacterium]